ncbi:MAG: hypothetical protein K2X01_02655 [Cyanobacteria bacterium]|nr:hypothetical protein [Cyanobacteriota bacterium]
MTPRHIHVVINDAPDDAETVLLNSVDALTFYREHAKASGLTVTEAQSRQRPRGIIPSRRVLKDYVLSSDTVKLSFLDALLED